MSIMATNASPRASITDDGRAVYTRCQWCGIDTSRSPRPRSCHACVTYDRTFGYSGRSPRPWAPAGE